MAENKAANTLYENGIGWGILLIIFFILVYLFWYYHATDVRDGIRWIRYGEMWLMSWFISDDYTIPFNGVEQNWKDWFETVDKLRADQLTYQHMSFYAALTMYPLRWILIAIMALGGLWCLLFGPNTQYRRKMNLEGLMRHQAKNFPVISPFLKFNPSEQPPRPPGSPVPAELPLFAEALGPEEWLAYNGIPAPDGKINETAAAEAFVTQLGERWRGPDALPPYQQILLAAFALKAARKRKEADDMLGRIAKLWSPKGLKISRDRKLLSDARRALKDKNISGKTLAQINRHAYATTALLRALSFARSEGGVLAPAQFLWLRGHDRALWYPLNNLGRQAFHPEAMGAMSHFKAERMTQRPIPVPKVDDAVKTIREYMASTRARPIPPLDYSGSRKRGVKMAQ